jgi:hypothetical protein
MKQGIVAVLVAIGLVAAGSASAHTTEFESVVIVTDGGFGKGAFAVAIGWAASEENEKCVADRKVKLRATGGESAPEIVDSARTSKNGGFYLFGTTADPTHDTLTVKMARKDIGKGDHKHICSRDSEFVDGPI